MRNKIVGIVLALSCAAFAQANDPDFSKKLRQHLALTEKSIELVRAQIIENQSAPFLPELYLQLAELMMKRSNSLYFIQKEKDKDQGLELDSSDAQRFPDVAQSHKETIEILQRVVRDFPRYAKRPLALYLIAVSHEAMGQTAPFIAAIGQLTKEAPDSEQALQGRILLGQHQFKNGALADALATFRTIESVKPAYERNLARHNIGRVLLRLEKFPEALASFEKVLSDPEFVDAEGARDAQSSGGPTRTYTLKREALIDSVQAYPMVHQKNSNPVEYYTRLAPSEELSREIIEKLAYRYIFLKRFEEAVGLLRVMSRTQRDPGKIVNLYRDILAMIPIRRRSEIKVEEIQFIFEKLVEWSELYEVDGKSLMEARRFYEEQLRELATTAHDLAKREQDKERKARLLDRARKVYLMYLGFFEDGPNAVKIAINLADVHYLQRDYLQSGDWYLRVFQGEFGPPSDKRELIENALRALEKTNEKTFYQQIRSRGLILHAIKSYIAFDDKQKGNFRLRFLYARTLYEQGLFDEALPALHDYMKSFPSTPFAMDAGDLILDHHNIKEDYNGLQRWVEKILALRLPNKDFNARIAKIGEQAKLKRVQETIKKKAGPDLGARDFLSAAVNLEDKELQSFALQQALARSKSEGDIDTFLRSAQSIAAAEKSPEKRADALVFAGAEALKVTRYYEAMRLFATVAADGAYPVRLRGKAVELGLTAALWVRDWDKVGTFALQPAAAQASPDVRQSLLGQTLEAIENPVPLPPSVVGVVIRNNAASDELATSLFKARGRVQSPESNRVLGAALRQCGARSSRLLCAWVERQQLEPKATAFLDALPKAPQTIETLPRIAKAFQDLSGAFEALKGSGDEHLEQITQVGLSVLYRSFAGHLARVGQKTPALQAAIGEKARQALARAQKESEECVRASASMAVLTPASRWCAATQWVPLGRMAAWGSFPVKRAPGRDVTDGEIAAAQKQLFAQPTRAGQLEALAVAYFKKGHAHHAMAAATQALSVNLSVNSGGSTELQTMLGCGLAKVGLVSQAVSVLKNVQRNAASEGCRAELRTWVLK